MYSFKNSATSREILRWVAADSLKTLAVSARVGHLQSDARDGGSYSHDTDRADELSSVSRRIQLPSEQSNDGAASEIKPGLVTHEHTLHEEAAVHAELGSCLAGIALALSDPLEELCNRRPIRRAFPDMMQGDPPHGVHENVSPQLADVASGTPQPVALGDQLHVRPPGGGPPDRRPSTATHPIGAVEPPPPVNQQGPSETRLAHVLLGTLSGLERHDDDLEAQPLDLFLVLSQLRQVLTAGQSAEVAVEDHQQPAAAKLLETIDRTGGVLQRKRDGRRPDLVFHFALTCRDNNCHASS